MDWPQSAEEREHGGGGFAGFCLGRAFIEPELNAIQPVRRKMNEMVILRLPAVKFGHSRPPVEDTTR